ncbi:uncharacterized protein LOC124648670 [Lolium rigidum]|uniref:uncharacterized protein LOC124648670 n=1 Tax=Lolium rigidum TaxID=89674 RepID=UPI001F5D3386|nr:uncharacterized protein LOC124648670 [Lolium rigidum]
MNTQRLELIRKRREEDDEEFMFLLLPILHYHKRSRRGQVERTQRHSSVLYGMQRVQGILDGHVKNCRVAYRMEPHIFGSLASYLRREKLLKDKRIKVEEKLAIFLYMLSHNASFEDLQLEFQHSNRTFHKCIREFFNIIPVLSRRFLKPPIIDHPHPRIANDDRFFPYFENCIGAIDGTHVPISISPHLAAPFRNRKGTLSHNVMIVSDFDLNVTYISCGWEGSATDARVLRSAKATGFTVPPGKFYLVDGGYANTEKFLAPYRGVRYHLKEWGHGHHRPQNYQELFNHRHALMRNSVERNIGILKKRFPILHVATFHKLNNQVKIPAATAIFHNIIEVNMSNGIILMTTDMKPTLHPVGTPKFNLKKAALGVRKTPPTNKKEISKRAQNGWSGDTWNRMTQIFQERNQHVNFVKSQLQDKEKELKREYKMLKEARMQSGAGWDENTCMIVAEKALWDNLEISFPRIGKFKRNGFPMYDSLGDLYDGQIAEGNHNFTSSSKASQLDEELEDERVQEAGSEFDEDLQIPDEDPTEKKDEGTGSSTSREWRRRQLVYQRKFLQRN